MIGLLMMIGMERNLYEIKFTLGNCWKHVFPTQHLGRLNDLGHPEPLQTSQGEQRRIYHSWSTRRVTAQIKIIAENLVCCAWKATSHLWSQSNTIGTICTQSILRYYQPFSIFLKRVCTLPLKFTTCKVGLRASNWACLFQIRKVF